MVLVRDGERTMGLVMWKAHGIKLLAQLDYGPRIRGTPGKPGRHPDADTEEKRIALNAGFERVVKLVDAAETMRKTLDSAEDALLMALNQVGPTTRPELEARLAAIREAQKLADLGL